jgi:alpha-mannosidase
MKFALEHQNPLVTGAVTGGSSLPEEAYSLLALDPPEVLLWSLKPAEDGWGEGIIARLWNQSDQPVHFSLKVSGVRVEQARVLTHIETPLRPAILQEGILTERLSANQIGTFSLQTL